MKVQIELKRWGNSLGLRIPYQIANSLEIAENSKVSLIIDGDRLIIEKEQVLPDLDEILESIPENFEYPEDVAEFVDSKPVGEESI